MIDEIYLETDEEVTSAIEKIKKSKKQNVVLCLPRHAVLGQSIVNLKLVYKEAAALGKQVALVSPDKITRTLAEKIGFVSGEAAKEIEFDTPRVATAKPVVEEPKKVSEDAAPVSAIERQRFDAKKTEISTGSSEEEEITEPETEGKKEKFITKDASPDLPPLPEKMSSGSPTLDDSIVDEPTHKENPSDAHTYGSQMIPSRGNLRFYRNKSKRKLPLVPIAIGLGVLVLGFAAAVLAIPNAKVVVTVNAQPFNETVDSNVDSEAKAVDVEKSVIPGKIIEVNVETKSSAKATGKKDMGEKATGTVTLYNEWDSMVHTFPGGTVLRAKNGNEFIIKDDVALPGATSVLSGGKTVVTAGKATTKVIASVAGEAYNNAATSFTIPSLTKAQQEKIYGASTEAFTGGLSKVVTVITQSDIDKLTENLKAKNKDDGLAQIKTQAGTMIVLDKAVQQVTQDAESSAVADTVSDTLEATVVGKYKVIAFTQDDHTALLKQLLANKIPQGQTLVTQGDGVGIDTSQFDLNLASDTRLELTNNIKAFTVTDFDKSAIRRSLIGVTPNNVKELVEKRVPVKDVSITVNPSGWPRLPYLVNKITVEYTYVGESKKAE